MTKHGAPDWDKYRPDSTTFPVQDMAELAARLGSINTYDRRGDVIHLEDFETGLSAVRTTTSGTGAAAVISPTAAKTGGYSIKLTAGSDETKIAGIILYLHPTLATSIGAEISWSLAPDDTMIELVVFHYTATARYTAAIRYHVNDDVWAYQDSADAWQTMETGLSLYSYANNFHTTKVVLDLTAHTYKRALLNSFATDLTDIPLSTFLATAEPRIEIRPRLRHTGSTNPFIYLDNIIITQDEP